MESHTGDFPRLCQCDFPSASPPAPTCSSPALCLHLPVWGFLHTSRSHPYTYLILSALLCAPGKQAQFARPECQTPIPSQALGPDQCVTSLPTTLPQFNTWTGTSIQYSALWIQLSSQLQIHKTPALIQPTFHHLSHKETMKETVSPRLKSRPTMFMAFT